ncbi:hypothetical protein CWB85_03535 [Pseudoalteromonas sp. S1727]|uniref:hypothetical protein n=1 Tax=Pseudoalteromonas sp. S1727 TaxID=2066514 RepID=UPI001107B7C5|nr:hypothetical protein [Pseudoalteromonas sp. S1727]TMN73199.1 hypothetical protein CWB85_03535 [Pseudoalteromonas sp. S1727]
MFILLSKQRQIVNLTCTAALVFLCHSSGVVAQCDEKPSANAFFAFMKEVKTKRLGEDETLLRAQADNLQCKPVFKLKVLDRRGQVLVRFYDPVSFAEITPIEKNQQWGLDNAIDVLNSLNPLTTPTQGEQPVLNKDNQGEQP